MELPHLPFPEEALTACILAACFFAASALREAGDGSNLSLELVRILRGVLPFEEEDLIRGFVPTSANLPKKRFADPDRLVPCLFTLSPLVLADLGVEPPPKKPYFSAADSLAGLVVRLLSPPPPSKSLLFGGGGGFLSDRSSEDEEPMPPLLGLSGPPSTRLSFDLV